MAKKGACLKAKPEMLMDKNEQQRNIYCIDVLCAMPLFTKCACTQVWIQKEKMNDDKFKVGSLSNINFPDW